MIRIWHTATHTTNIGDGALVSGIQNTLSEDWSSDIEFENDCLMQYENYFGQKKYDLNLVDEINNKSNLLIVGGGGMMDGGRGDKHSGMGFDIPQSLLDKITVPVVFYALGFNLFEQQIYWNKDKLKQRIEYLLDRPNTLFSVRNDGSKQRLEQFIGRADERIIEIPDPGMYVIPEQAPHETIRPGELNVIVQLAGDNVFSRFGLGSLKYLSRFLRQVIKKRQRNSFIKLASVLERLSLEQKVNYILCPHLVRDFDVTAEFISVLKRSFARFNFNCSPVLRGTRDAGKYFSIYNQSDLVIGMRGHSVICGVGLGVPTIALSSHPKVRGFMQKVGLTDRIVDVNDKLLNDKLTTIIHEILNDKLNERARLANIKAECRNKTKAFHDEIISLMSKSGLDMRSTSEALTQDIHSK